MQIFGVGLTGVSTISALVLAATSVATWRTLRPSVGSRSAMEIVYKVQTLFDRAVEDRYRYENNTHIFTIQRGDAPYKAQSDTLARSEIRIGNAYDSESIEFEADFYITTETSGVSIFQIVSDCGSRATALQLRIYNGDLVRYDREVIERRICGRWFNMRIFHRRRVDAIEVYVDGMLRLITHGNDGKRHYIKCGAYAQSEVSSAAEVRVRNVRLFGIE